MFDIDLIPQGYREALRIKRWLFRFMLACAAFVIVIAAARGVLAYLLEREKSALAALRPGETISSAHRAQLEQWRANNQAAKSYLKVLANLRGTTVKPVFLGIDRALNKDVWFLEIQFMRAGEFVTATPEQRNSGYFIIIPAPDKTADRAWKVQQHIQIKGQALTHSALTQFIKQLSVQQGIANVRLQNTEPGVHEAAQVVNFSLIALINDAPSPL